MMKRMNKIKVGIPRALLYYEFTHVWKAFLECLDLEVVISGETTDRVIKKGINSTGGDLCLPVKTFLGHVHEIKDSVDFLFIPRYISIEEDAYMCPKFIGLPDMVRAAISPLPPLIDAPMNLKKGGLKDFFNGIGDSLRMDKRDIENAYRKALNSAEIIQSKEEPSTSSLKIALLGRPYVLYDSCVNRYIIHRLKTLGADVRTRNRFSPEEINVVMALLPKVLYWSLAKEVVTSAYYFLRNGEVNGIINLVSVACGPDSFTSEIINGLRKNMAETPFMTLYLDEHTSDVGVLTRVEAFLDMIKRKKGEA